LSKLKVVDVVFAFNNSQLMKKVMRRGKAIRRDRGEDADKLRDEIREYLKQNWD